MSKFHTRLRQTAQGARGRSIGFAHAAASHAHSQLLIVAITDDASAVPSLIEAGAGSIITTSLDALEALAAAAGDVPVGIRHDATTTADAERIIAAGADFIAFDHTQTHAEALLEPDIGRVLLLEREMSEDELRTLAAMQLDALIVVPPPHPLLVRDQLALRRIVELSATPLVVPTEEAPSTSTLHAWRNAGTMAVLVPGDPDLVRSAITAAAAVPTLRQPREERGGIAIVPALTGHSGDFDDDDF
jgi:hypothetical protein